MSASSVRLGSALAGSYRLDRELGFGAMATVYLAEDVKHHREVAVKVLYPELSAVLGAERFLKEIELSLVLTSAPSASSIVTGFDGELARLAPRGQ